MKTRDYILAAILCAFVSTAMQAQQVPVPAAEPTFLSASTAGETNALFVAINKFRSDRSLAPLAADEALYQRAIEAFNGLVNAPAEVDVTQLRKDFAATDVAVLRGVVTHRNASSGAEFPKYWAKDARWNAVMSGNFTHIGAHTAKRSDGKLVAFVYLIKK
ncbi:MAG: hypothetical protein RLZZ505_2642 [Verrucomicrobiota bacterium]|jgi:uncharacterized protein YkwD